MRRVSVVSKSTAVASFAVSLVAAASITGMQPAQAAVDNHLVHVTVAMDGGQPDGDGGRSAISADGRYVAFSSSSTNLTPGVSVTGGGSNLYLRDTVAGVTTLVSHKPDGTANTLSAGMNSISANGRYIAYTARVGITSPGIRLKLWDRDTDTTTTISKSPAGDVTKSSEILPAISADGGTVVYAMRAAPAPDETVHALMYRYDVATDTTTQLAGGELVYPRYSALGRPSLSADGRFVAFTKMGPLLADGTQRTLLTRLNIATGAQRTVYSSPPGTFALALEPALSSSGRYLAFVSGASVVVYDSNTSSTQLVSRANGGGAANNASYRPSISADGHYVAYLSSATNILAASTDTTGTYIFDRQAGTTERFGVNRQGVWPRTAPVDPIISANGNAVVFASAANNLSAGASTGHLRVYVWTRPVPTA